jgi:hypothetical protein
MTSTGREVGEQFATSLAKKDRAALVELFAEDIDFRALTPGRFWEAASPAEIVDDVFFGHWFEPSDHVESLESVETADVGDRTRVGYRMLVRNDDGLHLVEQQAYLGESDGRISYLRILCSGFRPIAGQASESS